MAVYYFYLFKDILYITNEPLQAHTAFTYNATYYTQYNNNNKCNSTDKKYV